MVTRIDTTIPGTPLYEVKLDGFETQTYVNMTSDALLTYTQPQPLTKVQTRPVLENFEQVSMCVYVYICNRVYVIVCMCETSTRKRTSNTWV